MSPAKQPASEQRKQLQEQCHRESGRSIARDLMGSDLSNADCVDLATPAVCTKIHCAIAYAWSKMSERNMKIPMFATKATDEAVEAGNQWLNGVLKPMVLEPAQRLADAAIQACVQSIAQEFNQKLTFILEMQEHVLDLLWRAPLVENYIDLIDMCNRPDWWPNLTAWAVRLECSDLHIICVTIQDSEGSPK